MSEKGPGGADGRPDGNRKRKNDSHARISDALTTAYVNVEKEPIPESLLEILNRIPDPSADKERS